MTRDKKTQCLSKFILMTVQIPTKTQGQKADMNPYLLTHTGVLKLVFIHNHPISSAGKELLSNLLLLVEKRKGRVGVKERKLLAVNLNAWTNWAMCHLRQLIPGIACSHAKNRRGRKKTHSLIKNVNCGQQNAGKWWSHITHCTIITGHVCNVMFHITHLTSQNLICTLSSFHSVQSYISWSLHSRTYLS